MTRRRTAAVVAAAALSTTVLTGCGRSVAPQAAPNCERGGRPGSPAVVLMAQSVPTASLIPCMSLLPTGWTVSTVYAHSGSSRFVLGSDRAGPNALEVTLLRRCDTRAATSVPSDEVGTRRYERVLATQPDLRVVRYYAFPGGCTTYAFTVHGEQRAALINEANLAVGFVTRAAVAARVRADSHGELTLDPPGGSR